MKRRASLLFPKSAKGKIKNLDWLNPSSRKAAGFWGWDTKLEAGTLELRVFDVIGDTWFGGVSASSVAEKLEEAGNVSKIVVRVNSPGGDAFDGVAIMNLLAQHKAEVEVIVDGVAASAASVIAMAGDRIRMGQGAMMMIHSPWTCGCGGASELREVADFLDKVEGSILSVYQSKTGIGEAELAQMLADETWLSASEAIEKGFADDVIELPSSKNEAPQDRVDKVANVMAALHTFAAKRGFNPQTSHEENPMDEKEKAALQASLDASNAQLTELRKENTQMREDIAKLKAESEVTNKAAAKADEKLAEAKKENAELSKKVTEMEVDALVGSKITADEKDDFIELAVHNRALFDKMVEKRQASNLLERVVKDEINPNDQRPSVVAVADDDGTDFEDAELK
jgi:ATP-dependent protease ClpP protease subunit